MRELLNTSIKLSSHDISALKQTQEALHLAQEHAYVTFGTIDDGVIALNMDGEIDYMNIIAEQGNELVFIEVKTRSGTHFGSPFDSITIQKQMQLSKVALEYINKQGCNNRPARFDVVGIEFQVGGNTFREAVIKLLQNAFDLCYGN